MCTRQFVVAGLAGMVIASSAGGAMVAFAGPSAAGGTGFGHVLNVLALQRTGSEAGAVLWNGTTNILTGDASNQSRTRSVAELAAAGITATSDLGIVFNINESGARPEVTLQGFTVRFLSPTGATLFDAVQVGMQTLSPLNQGTGGAGYLYDIMLSATESAAFFSNPDNRIGIVVTTPIIDTDAGAENFFLVPAPGTAGLGLISIGLLSRRRR